MGTRRQVREQLVALFANQGFNQVLGYAPTNLNNITKVLAIYSSSTRYDMISGSLNNNFYTFYLDVFVKRVDGENCEDILDDLHEVVRSVVRANVGNSQWDNLNLNIDSDALFAEVSGVPYRLERHELIVKVTQE